MKLLKLIKINIDFQTFFVKLGKFDNTSSAVISRKIFFPVPVVTDRFVVTVVSGPIPLVFKMDIIGMDPDKKYATDPIFTPRMYQDCKLYCKHDAICHNKFPLAKSVRM